MALIFESCKKFKGRLSYEKKSCDLAFALVSEYRKNFTEHMTLTKESIECHVFVPTKRSALKEMLID